MCFIKIILMELKQIVMLSTLMINYSFTDLLVLVDLFLIMENVAL